MPPRDPSQLEFFCHPKLPFLHKALISLDSTLPFKDLLLSQLRQPHLLLT